MKVSVFINTVLNTQMYLDTYLNTNVFKYCPALISSEYDNYLHVYTDGSLFRFPLPCTAAFVVPSLDFSSLGI